jgi:hypothetical protein
MKWDRTIKHETLRSLQLLLMIGALAMWGLVFTSVAHADCSGSILAHNWQCSCNPGLHWDFSLSECQPDPDNPMFNPPQGFPPCNSVDVRFCPGFWN